MSITDATGSVGTSWTEKPTVAFLAGTLSTISDLVSEVEARIQRGTLGSSTVPTTSQVQNWLVIAKQELMESKGFTFSRRYAYAVTEAGTYVYAMPPDYNGGPCNLRNTTSEDYSRELVFWPPEHFDMQYPRPEDDDNDEPEIYTVKNMELWLWPPPDMAYTLELQYSRSGSSNTATDFSFLPEIERWRCCDFATYRAFAMLQDWNAAALYKQEWMYALSKSRKSDGRRRWSGRFQAISVFQEFAARGRALEPGD